MLFLGIFDLTKASLVLAILAGISQYFQALYMPKLPVSSAADPSSSESFQASLAKSMNTQMKYVFPFLIAFIAYKYSGVVALYLITSNIFAVGQQIYVKKTEKKVLDKEVDVIIKEVL